MKVKSDRLSAVAIGSRIRSARLDWQARTGEEPSQQEIGRRLGVTGAGYGKWENGVGVPRLENFEAIGRLFDRHPGWLAFGWEPREGHPPEAIREIRRVAETAEPPYEAKRGRPRGV